MVEDKKTPEKAEVLVVVWMMYVLRSVMVRMYVCMDMDICVCVFVRGVVNSDADVVAGAGRCLVVLGRRQGG